MDDGFQLPTPQASGALEAASALLEWSTCTANRVKVNDFSKALVKYLLVCLPAGGGAGDIDREKIWCEFHIFRTSKNHFLLWDKFLKDSIQKGGPILFQHITNYIFKQLIKRHLAIPLHVTVVSSDSNQQGQSLSYEERNALQYAAGYIPRNLRQKIERSAGSNKISLKMCLQDIIEEDGMGDDDSQDWLKAVDRGGLMHVTSNMFEFMVAMEVVVKDFLGKKQKPRDVKSEMLKLLEGNDNSKMLLH